jgi:antitoxin HicB
MRKTAKVYSYQINLIPEPEGGYTVMVPALPGCISYGQTMQEATRNAHEAIDLHLQNLAAHNEPIPEGHDTLPVFSTMVQVTPSNAR